jgi:hypothetical protein
MGVANLTAAEVRSRAIEALGLAAVTDDVASWVALSAAVRRAASFTCPTTPRALADAVTSSLRGLTLDHGALRDDLSAVIDVLVASGDLLEMRSDDPTRSVRGLVLGGPAYVALESQFVLVGVRADAAPLLTEDMMSLVEYSGHSRRITRGPDLDESVLAVQGLRAISLEQWLQAPRQLDAHSFVRSFADRLDASQPIQSFTDIRILDGASDVTYYSGRWRAPQDDDDGLFVARRPQQYGADLWCTVRLAAGQVTRVIDFPTSISSVTPAADEAWRLQAAMDSERGVPQRVRVHTRSTSAARIDFFGPLPSWAQRRLDLVGNRCERERGALFTYEVPNAELGSELQALGDLLWLSTTNEART